MCELGLRRLMVGPAGGVRGLWLRFGRGRGQWRVVGWCFDCEGKLHG